MKSKLEVPFLAPILKYQHELSSVYPSNLFYAITDTYMYSHRTILVCILT